MEYESTTKYEKREMGQIMWDRPKWKIGTNYPGRVEYYLNTQNNGGICKPSWFNAMLFSQNSMLFSQNSIYYHTPFYLSKIFLIARFRGYNQLITIC